MIEAWQLSYGLAGAFPKLCWKSQTSFKLLQLDCTVAVYLLAALQPTFVLSQT